MELKDSHKACLQHVYLRYYALLSKIINTDFQHFDIIHFRLFIAPMQFNKNPNIKIPL